MRRSAAAKGPGADFRAGNQLIRGVGNDGASDRQRFPIRAENGQLHAALAECGWRFEGAGERTARDQDSRRASESYCSAGAFFLRLLLLAGFDLGNFGFGQLGLIFFLGPLGTQRGLASRRSRLCRTVSAGRVHCRRDSTSRDRERAHAETAVGEGIGWAARTLPPPMPPNIP